MKFYRLSTNNNIDDIVCNKIFDYFINDKYRQIIKLSIELFIFTFKVNSKKNDFSLLKKKNEIIDMIFINVK